MNKKTVWLLAALLLLTLAGCQEASSGRPPGPVKPDDPVYPVLNPNPQHLVRVYGTVPENYRFQLLAHYQAESTADGCWRDGPKWQDTGEKYKAPWLDMKREGTRYEATLVVDKYLPGRCQWRFAAMKAYVLDVAKDDGDAHVVIEGRRFDEDDNAPRCALAGSPYRGFCTEEHARRITNSSEDIPVLMKCKWLLPNETMSGKRIVSCLDPFDNSHKEIHLLKPWTRQVQINVIDLNAKNVIPSQQRSTENKS